MNAPDPSPEAQGGEPASAPSQNGERDYAVLLMKITAGTFGVLFAALAIAWIIFAVALPTPAAICEHKIGLALEGAAEPDSPATQSVLENLRTHCVKEKKRRLKLRGKVAYWQYARCVLEAKTYTAAELC